ncbi:MAG: hypothetical protein WBM59_00395 [Sedimenticolaceae bacterium]
MTRLGRYWIFFVIVAVGLALSWGQIGRKTQRAFEEEPAVLLLTEPACRVWVAPCAAMASDRAVVAGPSGAGLGIRQTGLTPTQILRVEAVFLASDGSEKDRRLLIRGADSWSVPGVPEGTATLRIRMVGGQETTVAEFPLVTDQ